MSSQQEQEIGLLNMMAASAFAAREAPPSTFSVLNDDGASVNTYSAARTDRFLLLSIHLNTQHAVKPADVASPTAPSPGTRVLELPSPTTDHWIGGALVTGNIPQHTGSTFGPHVFHSSRLGQQHEGGSGELDGSPKHGEPGHSLLETPNAPEQQASACDPGRCSVRILAGIGR